MINQWREAGSVTPEMMRSWQDPVNKTQETLYKIIKSQKNDKTA